MTLDESNAVDTMLEIGKSALRGALSIEEFHDRWPQETSEHVLFKKIYDDIEDAVEHFPAHPLTGKPDRRWEKSQTYLVLYLDVLLLSQRRSPDELLRCRDSVLKQQKLSTETIRQRVEECLDVRLDVHGL